MTSLLRVGQLLKGKLGTYTVSKQIAESIWLATESKEQVIIKAARGHLRLNVERDLIKRFQPKTPNLRALVDEIQDPAEPSAIVLKHYDDDLLSASNDQTLTRQELKFVARKVLETLDVLHEAGYVHTDIKPDNILVNYGKNQRFSDVALADLGSAARRDSPDAKNSEEIGAPIFRSPEVFLSLPWSCSTDIFSFGALIISLLAGGDNHIFRPDIKYGEEGYELMILIQQARYFGPFPKSYLDFGSEEAIQVISIVENTIYNNRSIDTPFEYVTDKCFLPEDKKFLLKIVKLDPRDRPTAKDILADEWWDEL